jgi:hypothetical protein
MVLAGTAGRLRLAGGGFYVGNWNSNVSFTNASLEMDFYAGYKGEISKDFGYDVGILQYYYPQKRQGRSTSTRPRSTARLSWTFLTFKYSHHRLGRLLRPRQGAAASRRSQRRLAQSRIAARAPATPSSTPTFPSIDKLT